MSSSRTAPLHDNVISLNVIGDKLKAPYNAHFQIFIFEPPVKMQYSDAP